MQTQFIVVLDACVLYPAPVRDLLLQLASKGVFQAKWTQHIQNEWINSLLKNRPELSRIKLEQTCTIMNESILDSIVEDYQILIPDLLLPDMNDVHVLAAAIKCHAQAIITYNMKDFPDKVLSKFDIEALHPDNFLRCQLDLNLPIFLACVKTIRSRLRNPPKDPHQYLQTLFQYIPQTVSILNNFVDVI